MNEEKCRYFTGIPIANSTDYGCSIRIKCEINGFGMSKEICSSFKKKP